MISLVALAAIVVLLGILLLSNTAGTNASVNIVPDNEGSDSIREANISSASDTITITIYALPDEEWS